MSLEKNIDHLLGDIDSFLDINKDSNPIDIEKVALEHKEKKLRELRGNSYHLKALFFAAIAVLGLDPRVETFINVTVVGFAVGIMLWLHKKAKKEMSQIDVALSFNDFNEQRKNTAAGLLKLYKNMRVVMYGALLLLTGTNTHFFFSDPDLVSFIVYFGATLLGGFLIVRNMESVIKEYQLISQS